MQPAVPEVVVLAVFTVLGMLVPERSPAQRQAVLEGRATPGAAVRAEREQLAALRVARAAQAMNTARRMALAAVVVEAVEMAPALEAMAVRAALPAAAVVDRA
jgi:hypothetical protein